MVVCDAQVHAPEIPNPSVAHGINFDELLVEMAAAGVDRAVIIPLGDATSVNPSLDFARRAPQKFVVVDRIQVEHSMLEGALADIKSLPGVKGVRVAFNREPARSLLHNDGVEWLWRAAQALDFPVMIGAAHSLHKVGEIAARYPNLRLAIDHMGLIPFHTYSESELIAAVLPLLSLARYPNISVKASALPSSVAEPYPFRSIHEPLRRVFEAFGSKRVFWGSDLTRLPCSYLECRRLFTDELPYLSESDKEWIMGRAICEWLEWPVE